jgi:uncharacterized protein (DUF488 family)
MKIVTGNFANKKKYTEAGYIPVSIALYPPRYYNGLRYSRIAPAGWMLNLPEKEYTAEYNNRVLGKLDPSNVFSELSKLSGGKNVVLLCYEKAGDFCHRRLVAKWLEMNLGIEVNEYSDKPKEVQASLF